MTWPVWRRTKSGLARLRVPDAEVRCHLVGVDAVGAAGEQQQRLAVAVRARHREEQAVGDRADLAAEGVGGQLGGVHRVGEHDDPAGPAASFELGAEPA